MANRMVVPAQGFQGLAQQSVSVQALWNKKAARNGTRRATTAKKKRVGVAKKSRPRPKKRVAARGKAKPARLVKGSAAARRHMAKLRKMRKR